MFIVAPKGRTKLVMDFETPRFSSADFIVIGNVPELLAVVNENTIAGAIPLKKVIGFTFANKLIVVEYVNTA